MMEQKKGLTYKEAGVDTKEGERAVDLMKEHVKKTSHACTLWQATKIHKQKSYKIENG